MSKETQNNTPVSVEPVVTLNGAQLLQALDFIAPDRDTDPQQLECELTISFADGPAGSGYYCYCTDYPDEGAIMLDAEAPAAPVAAQPDVTQQTLDDVMAGIPARDAEIEALRKENEQLRQAINRPVSAEPVAHAMEAIMGYRLEFKPGEYCYYTPEGYALEAYKGDAPAHALYANPQPGCPSEVEVYKGWCWVRPKYNSGNIVDETFRPLFLGPQLGAPGAAQAQTSGDRAMLESLMRSFDMEMWNCPNCTATEETKDCDSAIMLREYLANNPVTVQAQQPVSGAEGLPPLPRGISKHSVIGHDADVYTDVHMLDYARAALAQQDATLHAEVLDMVRMLEANEWADHCGESELGQRLEWAITALQNQPQNIPEIIPESAKLDAETGKSVLVGNQGVMKHDAEKVQADLLSSLVEIVDAVIASDEEGLIEHSETIIKARAAIDAARKEAAHG